MSAPKRIQRKRTKGWRMPEGAVYVGRPSRWGNPFPIMPGAQGPAKASLRQRATDAFHAYVASNEMSRHLAYPSVEFIRDQLAGRDLACWCPLDQPCHADVLLQIANEETR